MDLSLFANTAAKSTVATSAQFQKEGEETSVSNTASEQAEEFDTFLELLTAQIRNQDPLAPLDSTQFVEQLATFSNLELQAKNNQILEGISNMLAAQLNAQNNVETLAPESKPDSAPSA